jgi:hypothetical protein
MDDAGEGGPALAKSVLNWPGGLAAAGLKYLVGAVNDHAAAARSASPRLLRHVVVRRSFGAPEAHWVGMFG